MTNTPYLIADYVSPTSGSSFTFPVNKLGLTPGDSVLMIVEMSNPGVTVTAATSSGGITFFRDNVSGVQKPVAFCYRVLPDFGLALNDTITVTCSSSATNLRAVVLGLPNVTAVDKLPAGNGGTGAAFSAATGTLTQQNEIAVGGLGMSGSTNPSGLSWTLVEDDGTFPLLAVAYKLPGATTASQTFSGTMPSGTLFDVGVITFETATTFPTNKVIRVGNGFQLNGAPYRMLGVNIWDSAVATWNQPPNGHVVLADNAAAKLSTWLTDVQATAPHVNTLRFWGFQQFAINAGVRDWSAIDAVLSVCDSHGIKVIFALEDNWDYERNGTHDPALTSAWFAGGYNTTVLQRELITYRAWVAEVVAHYANDTRIAMWEFGNEMNGITTAFAQDISGLIKGLDPNTLVGTGGVGTTAAIMALSTVDAGSYHYYTDFHQTGWQSTQTTCQTAGKPWYMGEMGNSSSGTTRSNAVNTLLNSIFAQSNTAGFVYWQYSEGGGDQFVINKGDPVLPVIDSHHL